MATAAAPVTFAKFRPWPKAADAGLSRALGDYAQGIRDGVNAGRLELWCLDGVSWLVTEVRGDTLIAWCYQGMNVRRLAQLMAAVARRNGLTVLEYSTRRKGLPRMLERFGFELCGIDAEGIGRYQAMVA